MANGAKKILLVVIFTILMLPLVQHYFPFIKSIPLNGVFKIAPDTPFSVSKWMDGTYQEEKSRYLNDNINFRADLIRLNCQFDYSLFRKFNTGWGMLGKNDCLFDDEYIKSWQGDDFVGYDTVHIKITKFKALQDTFARIGKSFILVYAASKPYYYADCIPDIVKAGKKRPTNFETFLRYGDSLGINQLDLNSWLCSQRSASKEILYPKQGIHWSMYSGMLVGDRLAEYVEQLRKIKMPHPKWNNIEHTTKPRATDDDIAKALNLIWPIAEETFAYGTLLCDSNSTKTRPRAIYIGDSFTWPILDAHVFDCINSNWEFWYYFKQRCISSSVPRTDLPMGNYNWQEAIDKTDYIVLLYTTSNIKQLGNGFIEAEYDHYFPPKK